MLYACSRSCKILETVYTNAVIVHLLKGIAYVFVTDKRQQKTTLGLVFLLPVTHEGNRRLFCFTSLNELMNTNNTATYKV